MSNSTKETSGDCRDVRTLLLCKIKGQYKDKYSNLYAPQNGKARAYITMGGFDAVNIYPTMDESECSKPGWAEQIYKDKENIIGAMDENISYHPIHLVSYSKNAKDFWADKKNNLPFLVVTFVYGIDKNKSLAEDSKVIPHLNTTTSTYERRLLNYLLEKNIDSNKASYVIYHAVNLSDLVLLWFTSDISYVLATVAQIEEEGIARKTYSSIGMPICDNQLATNVNDVGEEYRLRISGSIRDYSKFTNLYSMLTSSQGEFGLSRVMPFADTYFICGESDFSILTQPVKNTFLVNLFEFWLKYSEDWREACWEIHTDVLLPKNYSTVDGKAPSSPISDVLTNEYIKFRKLYEDGLKEYKWASTFYELLSVYVNIDRHPVLHGPGYLVRGCLHIANLYFNGEVTDFSRDSYAWKELMLESQGNIERFVRNWSQLTDQVTRIDDVLLHGLGNVTAIHNTLPEFIVDCYYSLMHQLVDILILCDEHNERANKGEFEYDFLFVPELSQRMRISKMFKTSRKFHKNKANRKIWPNKQAYLVEFPTQYIYNPKMFFLQLAHECFHCFGDTLRIRRMRANCMSFYLAAHFVAGLKLDNSQNTFLLESIVGKLHISEDEIQGEYYLEDVASILSAKLYKLANRNSMYEICENSSNYYGLYDDTRIETWIALENHFFVSSPEVFSLNAILTTCSYYFKECYADAMTVAFLGLNATEYLSLFKDEFDHELALEQNNTDRIDPDGNFCKIAQRIAVVLTACCTMGFLDEKECEDAIRNAFYEYIPQILDVQLSVFEALNYKRSLKQDEKWFSPVFALMYVVEYIEEALIIMRNEIEKPYLRNSLDGFRKNFDSIVRNENLFGKEFYAVMDINHNKIRSECKKKENHNA